ncbi:MAG: hypothetical protein HYU73_10760 [Betaproteobacteria bacterium]|nr:hypothetical protein [Betaproteobacteria bacterium]
MKRPGTAWSELLRAAALIIAMLLVPVGASAHGTGNRLVVAGVCTEAGQDAICAAEFDCMTPATGHRLHCHLASVPPIAAGPNQSLDDDQFVTAALTAPTLSAQILGTHFTPASRITIAARPRFILFGNFRS